MLNIARHLSAPRAPPGVGGRRAARPGVLTTFDKLAYPYVGDVNAPPASYIHAHRQAAESRPPHQGRLRSHSDPWSTAQVWLNPGKIDTVKGVDHTRSGFTLVSLAGHPARPTFPGRLPHLHVARPARARRCSRASHSLPCFPATMSSVRSTGPSRKAEHLDGDGFQDVSAPVARCAHAREHYEMALAATGDNFSADARRFNTSATWGGSSTGDCGDYGQDPAILGPTASARPQSAKSRGTAGPASPVTTVTTICLPYNEMPARGDADARSEITSATDRLSRLSTFELRTGGDPG